MVMQCLNLFQSLDLNGLNWTKKSLILKSLNWPNILAIVQKDVFWSWSWTPKGITRITLWVFFSSR